ncbi:hypothetical protein CMV_016172 [Castanea mollissima]|uniref:Uncharacterized protein n=1 Tax=Castanea mollissima TaxID=60419 RepID=A0A8J4VS18_9ROSI|nr:hypothetical protein CMV_016172 [Castanea mollissima]
MEKKIKEEVGCVHGVWFAPHDVEEESEEESLRVHSEKLALVCGGLGNEERRSSSLVLTMTSPDLQKWDTSTFVALPEHEIYIANAQSLLFGSIRTENVRFFGLHFLFLED